jgi:phosphopantetheine adenylyltransferase
MERRLADYETRDQEPEVDWEDMLRNNPLKALEEAGLGYDKLTELALNDGKLTPDMQLAAMRQELENDYKQKFEELENRLDQKEQLEQDTYYDSIQQNFQDEIGNIVHQNPEKFELIAASEADGLVYDVIEEHYNETGRVLDIEEAADAVESYLEEEANKLMKLKKISNRLGIDPSELEAMEQVTLSNDHSAQVNYEGANRMLSDDESKARAARILQWE